MTTPLIILGGGGHAAVLIETLSLLQTSLLGFTDVQPPLPTNKILSTVDFLGNDSVLHIAHGPDTVSLINGLGSIGAITRRAALFEKFSVAHYPFGEVIHPTAWLSPSVQYGEGLQILAGAVVNTRVQLGKNVLINSHAVVEHHSIIGNHSHIASGAVVCGDCRIGHAVHVGAGAVINQGITIGNGAIIASGAVVIADVLANSLMAGVPAQAKTRSKNHE